MKGNERHNNCKKELHFLRTAYLAVKSYFFTYDEKDTGQFICWFTDNSTVRDQCKRQFYWGLVHWDQSLFVKRTQFHRQS